MSHAQDLAITIFLWRRHRHMTQTEVADAVGVSRSAISSWENAERIPSWEMAVSVLKTLKVPKRYVANLYETGYGFVKEEVRVIRST